MLPEPAPSARPGGGLDKGSRPCSLRLGVKDGEMLAHVTGSHLSFEQQGKSQEPSRRGRMEGWKVLS